MKKSVVCLFTSALFMLTVSCSGNSNKAWTENSQSVSVTETQEETIVTTVEETTVTSETTPPETSETPETTTEVFVSENCMLKPGIWYAYNENLSSYYFISPDGLTARKIDVLDALSTNFRYECMSQETHEYRYYTSAGTGSFTLNVTGEETAELAEPGKPVSRMKYCSDSDFEHFQFFSDDELKEMVGIYYRAYYYKSLGSMKLSVVDKEDESVEIYLYYDTNGVQNIVDVYSIDRFTGAGSNKDGEIIDLCLM